MTDLLFDAPKDDAPKDDAPKDASGEKGSADPADGTGTDRPRRPPLGGAGLGVLLVATLVTVQLSFPDTAQASPGVPAVGQQSSVLCTLMPWLCKSSKTSTPTTTPTPTPTSSTKSLLPSLPGLTSKSSSSDTASSGTASGCDQQKRSNPSGLSHSQSAKLMVDCAAAQLSGLFKNNKRATSDAKFVASPLPMHLTATKQTIKGLTYDGIATLQTSAGPIETLKLRANSVTIEGIKQSVTYSGGTMTLTSTSNVVLSGNVSLYVLKQKGNVFGLLPLTLSVAAPPPLVLPDMYFTNVDQQVAYLQADTLKATPINITVSA